MYNLYVWIVGFLLCIFSLQLSKLMIKDGMTIEQLILLMGGIILMLLSPKK